MTVYQLPPADPYRRPFRALIWGAAALLLGILVFALHEPAGLSDRVAHAIGWFAGAVTLAALVAAFVFAAEEGIWKSLQTLRFDISDGKIVRTRKASSSIELPLNEIEYLRESKTWLLVGGGNPKRQIAIPKKLTNFDLLKGELAAHCAPTPLKVKVRPSSFLPLILTIVAYVLLFTSHSSAVVIGAGVSALAFQGGGTYSLLRMSQDEKLPKILALTFALSVLAVAWLVYRQIAGPV